MGAERGVMDDDLRIAKWYITKADNARVAGQEFSLSFNQFKKIVQRKTCYYTLIPFQGDVEYKRTLDRIDNTKGYVPGNVVVCLNVVNNIKAALENPTNLVGPKHLKRMCEVIIKQDLK